MIIVTVKYHLYFGNSSISQEFGRPASFAPRFSSTEQFSAPLGSPSLRRKIHPSVNGEPLTSLKTSINADNRLEAASIG